MLQNEKVIETKICKYCSNKFDITDKDLEFYEKVSPVFSSPSPSDIPLNWGGTKGGVLSLWNGKVKYLIPPPTLCPDCRQQRRLSFRNERKLYKRKCDFSGKDIVSIYSPDKPYKVYEQSILWGDQWSAFDYGMDFDFSQSFFEQFEELLLKVPRMNLLNVNNENSPYAHYSSNNKNVYLISDVMDSENIYFANTIKHVKNSLDLTDIENSENCYECLCSSNLYQCFYTYYSQNYNNSLGLYACRNVNHSLFCSNLNNKEYYLFNRKSSKEEYEKLKKACKERTVLWENLKKFQELVVKTPKRNLLNINSEGCIWDNLYNSQNCSFCFEGINIKDCKYSIVAHSMSDCMDTTIHNPNCFLDYEAVCWGLITNGLFNATAWDCNNIMYCDNCYNSSYIFWCIWIAGKSYCIFNKQYTKEEYEKLVPKIIEHMQKTGEWWDFFPSLLSHFGYNESVAQEYFPLTRDKVVSKNNVISSENERSFEKINNELYKNNVTSKEKIPPLQSEWQTTFLHWPTFNWSDYEAPFPKVEKIIPANKLPENIEKIPDDILNRAIECEVTKKPFRIIKQELEFYRKYNLPIPRRHPDQRHLDRMKLRNPRKLFARKCDKCVKEIQTTYNPERPEIIYCEECYEKEIY